MSAIQRLANQRYVTVFTSLGTKRLSEKSPRRPRPRPRRRNRFFRDSRLQLREPRQGRCPRTWVIRTPSKTNPPRAPWTLHNHSSPPETLPPPLHDALPI